MDISLFTKPICKFLIHRYMGQYLKTELTTDQLEFRLADGTASVQRVSLNVEYINEILDPIGAVSLSDGYVEEISTCVPWKKLMSESTIIKICGLELTLSGVADLNKTNTQELVSSMIGSIASTMDLARSVIADEQIAGEVASAGVEQFAGLIDQVISRIKVIFEHVIIRFEADSQLCAGLEIQIDKMEFVDEQLEARQQQNENEAITMQPSSLYSVTDLNKLLHLQGVRIYTDLWSPLKERRLSTSRVATLNDDGDDNFQSCYSQFANRSMIMENSTYPNSIAPTPVLIAQFFCDRHTVRIRVNNTALSAGNDNCVYNKRVDIDISIGGTLFFYLTPSQLSLLSELIRRLKPPNNKNNSENVFGGRPMRPEHFQKITDQFHGELSTGQSLLGGWGGQEKFYEIPQQNVGSPDFNSIPIHPTSTSGCHSSDTASVNKTNSMDSVHSREQSTSFMEKRPDIFTFTLRAPTLVGVITHDDPLSMDNMKTKNMPEFAAIRSIIADMLEDSKKFFKIAETVKINRFSLDKQREVLDELCKKDHMRLVSNGATFSLSVVTEYAQNSTEIIGALEECDFCECLQPSSVMNYELDKPLHIDLLNFSDRQSQSAKDVLTFKIANTLERPNEYSIELNMENCKSEIDPSVIDRISNLIAPDPCFAPFMQPKLSALNDYDEINPSLRDNLLSDAINSEMPTKYTVKFYATRWNMSLRVPIANLTEYCVEYTKRNVYPEYLKILLHSAFLEIPKFSPSDIINYGSFMLQCKSLTGSFIGDLKQLNCTKDEMLFLHANSVPVQGLDCRDSRAIKIMIDYDLRNKSLRATNLSGLDESSDTSLRTASFMTEFRKRTAAHSEGPFSKRMEFSENEPRVMAGRREELTEFSGECREMSNINIEFSTPRLNLLLPSSKFFEIIYNRFANDLALWEPKAPSLKRSCNNVSSLIPHFSECMSYNNFGQEHEHTEDNYDDFIDDVVRSKRREPVSPSDQNHDKAAHIFTFTLRAKNINALLQTTVNYAPQDFISQLGTNLLNAELFLVYGYNEDPNLSYSYFTSADASIYHRNLLENTESFLKDVLDIEHFGVATKKDIHVESIPAGEPYTPLKEDNLSIALKMHFYPDENIKDIIVAFGLRNTLLHFKPFRHTEMFWVEQFSKFFNVIDYEVPGYTPPEVKMNLHVDLKSILLGYDHVLVIPNSPNQLRLEIGHCHLNSRIMADMVRFRFLCEFQETNIWMRQLSTRKSNNSASKCNPVFVKILHIGFFKFIINYTSSFAENLDGSLVEFTCNNDFIKVWVCADTIIEFVNMIIEFVNSDTGTFLLLPKAPEKDTEQQLADLVNNLTNSLHAKEQQDRIEQMVASALKEPAYLTPKSLTKKRKDSSDVCGFNSDVDDSDVFGGYRNDFSNNAAESFSSSNTDDEFIMIEKVASTKNTSKRPNEVKFEPDFEFVVKLPENDELDDGLSRNSSPPILKYVVSNISFHIYMFGGNDFGDSFGTYKTYSKWDSKGTYASECVATDSHGGHFRDQTVCVEAKILNVSFISEIFNATSKFLSLYRIKIGSIEVLDHLLVSDIHKIVYPHRLSEQPLCNAPILSLTLSEDQSRESTLKISLMPIRLNFDQDTLEFLQEFTANVAQNLKILNSSSFGQSIRDHAPVMEVPNYSSDKSGVEMLGDGSVSFSASQRKASFDSEVSTSHNLDYMFSEEDVQLSDSCLSSLDGNKPDLSFSENKRKQSANTLRRSSSSATNSSRTTSTFGESSSTVRSEIKNYTSNAPNETFIKEFIFYPPCKICMDYVGKRVKTDQGALIGFLIGMMNLRRTEITLKDLHNEKGMLGFNKCVQYTLDEWIKDIRNRQMAGVFGSYAPISALVELTQGVRDLFAIPLGELRKEDGHVVRGIQQGASSFSLSTATAAIDATQRMASIIQSMAEFAFDLVTPDYAYQRYRRNLGLTRRTHVAGDVREGLTMAYDTMRDGVLETAHTLSAAAQEDLSCGGGIWGLRGILRHATPTAIRPIVIASQATVHVLSGIKNQLRPDEHREELEKWRRSNTSHKLLSHSHIPQITTKVGSSNNSSFTPPAPNVRRY